MAHSRLQDYGLLYDDSSDESSTDDSRHVTMARTLVEVHHSIPIDVFAYNTTASNPIAYADGGADSCIGGNGWKVLEYTGRKANLIGYDERSTKKNDLNICTLAIKV